MGLNIPQLDENDPAFLRFFQHLPDYPDDNGCIVWQGGVNRDGYGKLWDGKRKLFAHRFSYAQFKGEIPEEMCVLHFCDNPPCVNPLHLRLGTHTDNMREMSLKGRYAKTQPRQQGETHHGARYTNAQVGAMREMRRNGCPLREIAQAFNIPEGYAAEILRGEVRNRGGADIVNINAHAGRRIRDEDVPLVFRMRFEQDLKHAQIAAHFKVSRGLIGRILQGQARLKASKHFIGKYQPLSTSA